MSEFILPKAPNYEGALLLAKDVTMRFGGVTAVSDLSIALPKGAIAGIIGPNGAGKTTAFNVLSGFYTPQAPPKFAIWAWPVPSRTFVFRSK